jgi:long-chain acyl-CoA synthetase
MSSSIGRPAAWPNALRRLGVEPGDRVMVMLPNCPEVLQSYGGILRAGGVIVPVIFLLGDAEVAHILADSESKVVITSNDMLWKVDAQIGVLPTLRHVLLVDGEVDRKCSTPSRRPRRPR